MTLDQLNKKSARAFIADAMKIFRGPSYVKQPKKVISSASYNDLSRHQLDQGVIAMVVHCNLTGGPILDVNLYKLMRTYLWSTQARTEINAVVGRYGL
jgi:hypothetical protein